MTVRLVHPWTGEIDYTYDYVGAPGVERILKAAGRGGPVPAHLRGSGYAGAARLGHGKGYVYAHDEPDAVAAQQYLPDDLAGTTDYYRPSDRGFEARLQERWTWLKGRLGR